MTADFAFEIVEDITEVDAPELPVYFYGEEEDVNLLDCNFCGSCVDPDTCVWGVVCPECNVEAKEHCRVPGSGKLTGLHEQRWELAKGRQLAWR